jgi:hypothetical protein
MRTSVMLWIGVGSLVGITLTCAAAVAARYRTHMCAVRERLKSLNSQIIDTSCGPIQYLRSADGYPLLVVHGAQVGSTRDYGWRESDCVSHVRNHRRG